MGKNKKKNANPLQPTTQIVKPHDSVPVSIVSTQPQQIIQHIQPITFTVIDSVIYNNLLNENKTLKEEIHKLDKNYIDELREKNKTIDELRIENTKLKKEIETLKNTVEILNNKVFDLEKRLDKSETNTLFNKFLIAIQDINRNDQLEKSIHDVSIVKKLKKLRQSRNGMNHYIYEDDDEPNEIDYKKFTLYNKLLNLDENIKEKFNKKFPNLIGHIIKYISPTIKMNPDISQEMKAEIEEWWKEE